jgi:hypothetical protein
LTGLQFFAKAGSAFLLENFFAVDSVQKKVAADFSAATFLG